MWHVCVCICVCGMEYYSAIKKDGILPFATTWMNPEVIMLSEISGEERQIPYDFTHTWNIKKQNDKINEPNQTITNM